MDTYYPHQYPTSWAIDPKTNQVFAQRPEKFYGVLFKSSENLLIDSESLGQELQRFNCFLLTIDWKEDSQISDFSQYLIAAHFGLVDSSLPKEILAWILGSYAGLNRPLFILNRINATSSLPFGSFKPALSFPYETHQDILRHLLPGMNSFLKNLVGLNDFETTTKRFLEYCLKKLNTEQINILKFILLLDRNPYMEEEIVSPLRNYSERYLDIFLSEWSECMVSLGLLQKKQIQLPHGDTGILYSSQK